MNGISSQSKAVYASWNHFDAIILEREVFHDEDEVWTRYKCGMKLLQYMALGIPGIASSVGATCQIITSGMNGLLAKTPREWFDGIDLLLSSEGLRAELGHAARTSIEERYSLQKNHLRLSRRCDRL